MRPQIFISYAWESESHNNLVISFCNHLRKEGFAAKMDILLSQNETAIHFQEMMHKGISDSNKVIIILSQKYKEKANSFQGGVGNEYRMILNEIDKIPQKYILVSFEKDYTSIVPSGLQNRKIISFTSYETAFNELVAMIKEESIIDFSNVSEDVKTIQKKEIDNFQTLLEAKNNSNNLPTSDIITVLTESDSVNRIFEFVSYHKSILTLKYKYLNQNYIFGIDTIFSEQFSDPKHQLRITFLHDGGGWHTHKTIVLENEEYFCSFEKNNAQILNNNLFIVFETSHIGTAYNGISTYNFCMMNLLDYSFEVIKYSYVAGDFVGEYINLDSISEETQMQVLPFAKDFLKKNGIGDDEKLEINAFPHIEWVVNNPSIYENIIQRNFFSKIIFTPISTNIISKFLDQNKEQQKHKTNDILYTENEYYCVYAGFVMPIIGLDKINRKYFMIFVPQGYPAGAAWGIRSYYINHLKGHILSIYNNDSESLTINLQNGEFSANELS